MFASLTSTPGIALPIEPVLYSLLVPTATTGDVSVRPYPCTIFIPSNLYLASISESKAAAPLINNLIFPPIRL